MSRSSWLSLREPAPGQRVRAVPGAGLHVPIWILGSSLFGAQLAAELGLPFAFASHFAPAQMMAAIDIYRSQFSPQSTAGALERPYLMLGVNVVAADTDQEARRLFTSHQQVFLALRRGQLGPVPPPVDPDRFAATLTPLERDRAGARAVDRRSSVGPRRSRADCLNSSRSPTPTSSSSPPRYLTMRRD